MSEHEQDRPLTRRELREREQAAMQAMAESAAQLAQPAQSAQTVVEADVEIDDIDVEISPYNEDGSLRSRREQRELREAEIARIIAERRASAAAVSAATDDYDAYSAPTEPFSVADLREAESVREEAQSAREEAERAREEAEAGFDDDVPPTEAFTLEELLDAVEPTSPTGDAEAVAALFGEQADSRAGESEPAQPDEVEEAGDTEELGQTGAPSAGQTDAGQTDGAQTDGELSAEEPVTYSFPDIRPPEEWRSVFDDPSRAAAVNGDDSDDDFDDLISRAVAHEGHTGRTGTSALILPSHPGDTGGLAGPLGMTGELYVTGSIELPKSIGETGGHAALHDSIDLAPFLTGEQPSSITSTADGGPVPVSAMNAVSARRRPEIPVVAEPTKDRSKVPLVLALSGGGLLVVLAGVAIYAATQGWFA